MRSAALLALALTGCAAAPRPTVEFPVLPDLPAETRRACPALPPVTGTLGDLAAKDAGAAIEYARCQARAATAIGAYDAAQRLLRAARDAVARAKPASAR